MYEADTPLEFVYFPAGAALSMIKTVANGDTVEVAAVGLEGMAGIHAALGGDLVPDHCVAQIPGPADRMNIGAFYKHFKELPVFRHLVSLYAQAVYAVMAQSVACNRLHHINQRCARWLLTCEDRVGRATFDLTQEFLATMLGSSRPSVSTAASELQEAGLIRYARGILTINNREGLENASCECYAVTVAQLERVLPATPSNDVLRAG